MRALKKYGDAYRSPLRKTFCLSTKQFLNTHFISSVELAAVGFTQLQR